MAKDRSERDPKRAPGARLPRLGPIFYNEKFQPLLGGRSTVGQRTLTPLIGVRIPASQPKNAANCRVFLSGRQVFRFRAIRLRLIATGTESLPLKVKSHWP
jgi:hypothetical protein